VPAQRNTRQRQAIRKVFEETSRPLRPLEILDLAQRHVNSIGLATVYRCLKALTDEGFLLSLTMPEVGTLYERADKKHHHHFYCRACDQLFDLEGCTLEQGGFVPPGYALDSHEIFLYGTCATCSTGATS